MEIACPLRDTFCRSAGSIGRGQQTTLTMKAGRLAIIAILVLVAACSNSTQPENPTWVNDLIKKFRSEPLGNPPQSIWRYQYRGQTVYYVPPQCCDQFSDLYDSNGNRIYASDVGFSGGGDGHCTDFLSTRTNEKLVWKDPRGG